VAAAPDELRHSHCSRPRQRGSRAQSPLAYVATSAAEKSSAAVSPYRIRLGRDVSKRGERAVLRHPRHERSTSPDAITQVERSLERHRKLFSWGHISEADYLREAARLAELREQLTALCRFGGE